MVNKEFRRRLTGKIAEALVDRLEKQNNEQLAYEDIERLRRLHTTGEINTKILLNGLEVVKANEALSQKTRDDAESDIDLLSKKFHIDLNKVIDVSSLIQSDVRRLENVKYRFSNVILPATINVDSLPQSGWTRVVGDDLIGFLGQIGPVDGIIRTVPETTICHWSLLPWYESVAIIRLTDPTWRDKKLVLYYLILNGNLYRLNGTSPPIHEVNAKAPIKLSQENVGDYLRFFCFFVRGEEGAFYLAEDIEDPFIPHFKDSNAQEILSTNVTPLSCEGRNEKGQFVFHHVTVFYSNALFKAVFAVQPTGMVEMLNDVPIAGDLPDKINAPISL